MTDRMQAAGEPAKVTVSFEVDAQVHAAFLRKAQQANMDIGSFLAGTLTIVLGCRAFDEKLAKSPGPFGGAADKAC